MHTNSHELSAGYGEAPSPGRRGDRSPEAFEFVFIRVNSWLPTECWLSGLWGLRERWKRLVDHNPRQFIFEPDRFLWRK